MIAVSHKTQNNISDMAYTMENKKKMRRLHTILLTTGIPVSLFQWFAIILWIATGNYIPFIIFLPLFIIYAIWISTYYFKRVAYICPHCKEVFVPTFKEAFFAKHTPKLRKLKCPSCGHKGYCVETYREGEV